MELFSAGKALKKTDFRNILSRQKHLLQKKATGKGWGRGFSVTCQGIKRACGKELTSRRLHDSNFNASDRP